MSPGTDLCRRFLGTGFTVTGDGGFMTAAHVIEGLPTTSESVAAIRLDPGGTPKAIAAHGLVLNPTLDVGFGFLETDSFDPEPLLIASAHAPMNDDVLTVEFSGTEEHVPLDDGRMAVIFSPYFRKGHIIRYYKDAPPGWAQAEYLDLSFPALKGASGAPVIAVRSGEVLGLVLANRERHLLPAHVERVVREGDESEEVSYFLPTGLAISWRHIQEFVDSLSPNR